MVTERTIINALIIGASFILVPFVISSSLTVDYAPALFFGGLFALVMAFFFLKETLCIWPLLGGSIAGTLNFLPLPLKGSHVFCILLIIYYITGYVIIRQKPMKLGKTRFLWPILIITMIVLYHNHSMSLHVLGGETEGGKPAFLIYLVVLAYFCGINIASPSVDFLSKVPLYCVILAFFSNMPFFLTNYIPSIAPYVYSITDNVDVGAYLTTQGTASDAPQTALGRMGAFIPISGALQLYLICHYPMGTWLRPGRWWVIGLSLVCAILAVQTGFRSALFGYVSIVMVGAWCYYSWRSIFLFAIPCIVMLGLVVASNDNLIHLQVDKLPLIAQRTMSFLPGDWDKEAISSAESSNEFRKNIQDLYIKEYLQKSPWFGNGFDIDTKTYKNLSDYLLRGGVSQSEASYLSTKVFIEGKLFHTGWISVYDAIGIVGSMAFIVLGWNTWSMAAHFVFRPKADRRSPLFPLYVWIFVATVSPMITFVTVFGDFKEVFMGLCINALVLSHLSDIENTSEVPTVLTDRKRQAEFSRLSGGDYGYQSRP